MTVVKQLLCLLYIATLFYCAEIPCKPIQMRLQFITADCVEASKSVERLFMHIALNEKFILVSTTVLYAV